MSNYDIELKDFALSAQGIHLLRNRFNYKTLNFNDIHKAVFIRGAETKNVTLALAFGVLLIFFAIYNAIGVYENFHDSSAHTIYIESIVLPVLPLLAGLYCIYISIKKVPLLVIELKEQKHKLSLKDVINTSRRTFLETYLREKLGQRFYSDPTL